MFDSDKKTLLFINLFFLFIMVGAGNSTIWKIAIGVIIILSAINIIGIIFDKIEYEVSQVITSIIIGLSLLRLLIALI